MKKNMNFERWFAKKFGVDLRYNEINARLVHTKSIPSELDDPYRRLVGSREADGVRVTHLNADWMEEMRELYNDRQKLMQDLQENHDRITV